MSLDHEQEILQGQHDFANLLSTAPIPKPQLIAVMNVSTVVTDDQVIKACTAMNKSAITDFLPQWGIYARMSFAGKNPPTTNYDWWWMVVADNSDVASALGYHDITDKGLPLGKCFAKTAMDHNDSWTVTLSHEFWEMLGDPYVEKTATIQGDRIGNSQILAYELSDPVEADQFAYSVDGIQISDWITPKYFSPGIDFAPGTKFSFHTNVKPLEILDGGYQSVYIPGQGWVQQDKFQKPCSVYKDLPTKGSRREKRSRKTKNYPMIRSMVS